LKVSEITLENLKNYFRVDYEEDDIYIQNIIMPAVLQYIKSYTGLENEVMDTKEDLTIAYMILASDMYNNRDYTVQNDKINPVVNNILNRYSVNLL
jgi:uncharacterized phage protein (predicted DNA packaging)